MNTTVSAILVSGITSATVAALVAGSVNLQDTTPGVAQTGHINVTGTAIAGKVRVGTSIAGGYLVRVEDGSAVGGVYSRSGGNGVYSESTGPLGPLMGGQFVSRSSTGRGVIGSATSATGSTRGGIFDSKSSTGVGVYGLASASSGTGVGVFGSAGAASATAIVASNPNADWRVDLAGPNGAVFLYGGSVNKNFGFGVVSVIPIAYGSITNGGAVFDPGTGNWSVVKNGTGDYRVTIQGESYVWGPYVTMVSVYDGGEGYTNGGSTFMQVLIKNSAGTAADKYFQFVTFKRVPEAMYPPMPPHGYRDQFAWAKAKPKEYARFMEACREAERKALAPTQQQGHLGPQ